MLTMGRNKKTKLFLNVSDFADELGVSRQTVYNYLLAGTCPVAPIVGMKPVKWSAAKVTEYKRDLAK